MATRVQWGLILRKSMCCTDNICTTRTATVPTAWWEPNFRHLTYDSTSDSSVTSPGQVKTGQSVNNQSWRQIAIIIISISAKGPRESCLPGSSVQVPRQSNEMCISVLKVPQFQQRWVISCHSHNSLANVTRMDCQKCWQSCPGTMYLPVSFPQLTDKWRRID